MIEFSHAQKIALLEAAAKASQAILALYHAPLSIAIKEDKTPVTTADIHASHLLRTDLPKILPFPVLSEEHIPKNHAYLNWQTYWLIDPIDGTRHFIEKTGEFCICIALIHQHQAVLGLIYHPLTASAWFANQQTKTLEKYVATQQVVLPQQALAKLTATISADKLSDKMQDFLKTLGDFAWYSKGSALKYIELIEGRAHLYPRMWYTSEWDTAAGQCLLNCAGGEVISLADGKPLRYGQKQQLLNPYFVAYRGLSTDAVSALLSTYQQLCEAGRVQF